MISVLKYIGGLGNQMFQYSFYLSLRKEYKHTLFLWDISGSCGHHQGFELTKIFNIKEDWRYKVYRKLHSILFRFMHVYEQPRWTKYDDYPKPAFTIYSGGWQTLKYFSNVEDEVRQKFRFKEELLNEKTKELARYLRECPLTTVSIHVRRGDYITCGNSLCPIEYYQNAIKYITKEVNTGCKFLIFSDDIPWTKQNIQVKDCIYVDWNKHQDSWQDMFLMSLCRNNIIANSTFSWWGAWLNPYIKKTVFVPKKWLTNEFVEDITPDNWIKL